MRPDEPEPARQPRKPPESAGSAQCSGDVPASPKFEALDAGREASANDSSA